MTRWQSYRSESSTRPTIRSYLSTLYRNPQIALPLIGGALAVVGAVIALKRRHCHSPDPIDTLRLAEQPDPCVAQNPVDEASWESFPASDPPAFY
jgi:hypothetical protein